MFIAALIVLVLVNLLSLYIYYSTSKKMNKDIEILSLNQIDPEELRKVIQNITPVVKPHITRYESKLEEIASNYILEREVDIPESEIKKILSRRLCDNIMDYIDFTTYEDPMHMKTEYEARLLVCKKPNHRGFAYDKYDY